MSEIKYEHYIDPCKKMLQDGKTVEDVLEYLRAETNSKVASMATIMYVLNITADEAKLLVHNSKTWEVAKERDEKFHEKLFSALDDMNNEEK